MQDAHARVRGSVLGTSGRPLSTLLVYYRQYRSNAELGSFGIGAAGNVPLATKGDSHWQHH